ncbi:integrase-like protein [Curtobacterium sp. PhB171]|nr:integrase-like protein [Curtobacterium sp. PhB171]ROQ22348.1 integrase-like protein [Curtobacterium sp. PhB170]ROS33708.1 integrase-like protein [Curtobacterium sp. PhB131]ROS65027.1 integrase-like protein [Curtobacterium sp. PhB141]
MVMLRRDMQLKVDGRDAEVVSYTAKAATIRMLNGVTFEVTIDDLTYAASDRFEFDEEAAHDPYQHSRADWETISDSWRTEYRVASAEFEWVKTGDLPDWLTDEERDKYPAAARTKTAKISHLSAKYQLAASTMWTRYRAYKRKDRRGAIGKPKISRHVAHPSVDPRYIDEVRAYGRILQDAGESVLTAQVFHEDIEQRIKRIEDTEGIRVRIPKKALRYQVTKETLAAAGTLTAAISRQEGIAHSSKKEFRRINPTRPGEFVLVDTTRLDVRAFSVFSAKAHSLELTWMLDLYSRCILAIRVAPIATGGTDLALLLFDLLHPRRAPWAFHNGVPMPNAGLPDYLLINSRTGEFAVDGDADDQIVPSVRPETIVTDNGSIYISEQMSQICGALGINILRGRVLKADDKAQIEASFRTLRTSLLVRLLGSTGGEPSKRGRKADVNAVWTAEELDNIVRGWVANFYHHTVHTGIHRHGIPGANCTPMEKLREGLLRSGVRLANHSAIDAIDLLPIQWVTIQRYGVNIDNLVYDSDVLKQFVRHKSRYVSKGGKWPLAVNPLDRQYVYFQHPATGKWHSIRWIGSDSYGGPFSQSMLTYSITRLHGPRGMEYVHRDSQGMVGEALASWVDDLADAAGVTRREDAILLRAMGWSLPLRTVETVVETFRSKVHIRTSPNRPKHRAESAPRQKHLRSSEAPARIEVQTETQRAGVTIAPTEPAADSYWEESY